MVEVDLQEILRYRPELQKIRRELLRPALDLPEN